MKIPRFIYAELTPSSVEKLKNVCHPKFINEYCHHSTIAYKPTEEQFKDIETFYFKGKIISIVADFRAFNETCDALFVSFKDIDSGLPLLCLNKFPHITISTNGVPPKNSNDILNGKNEKQYVVLELEGVIKYDF